MSDQLTAAVPLTDDPAEVSRELVALATQVARNPYGFVLVAFRWGEAALAGHAGPDKWQRDILEQIGAGLMTPDEAIRIAISTGHGTGKSCLVAWIVLWAMVTCDDCRGVITANTETQLKQKTFAELAKWHRLCLWRSWFTLTATALHSADPAHEKTWRIDAVAWSERSVEAFAGLHNAGKRILVVFDEASAIPDVIWETTEGALTDERTEIVWLVAGNPTRNTGRFRECFGRFKHRWLGRQVDSREVRITNKVQIAAWVSDYGEDSDFVRVRVRGVFPRAGTMQFISSEAVEEARKRVAQAGVFDPLIMGVDVARFGDDRSVICFRRGRDSRSIPAIVLRGVSTTQLAGRVAAEHRQHQADALFVDGGGVGGGVVDQLRDLGLKVFDIQFGGAPIDVTTNHDRHIYANRRAEMWGNMRSWLEGGAIEDDEDLAADLIGPEYGYVLRQGRDAILLESKESMKARGLASSDRADALALTFAMHVAPLRHPFFMADRPQFLSEYNPFSGPEWSAQGDIPARRPIDRVADGGRYARWHDGGEDGW